MSPEIPSSGKEQQNGAVPTALEQEVSKLQRSLGTEHPPVSEHEAHDSLLKKEEELKNDWHIDGFHELSRANELRFARIALMRAANKEQDPQAAAEEQIVANQARTLYEYMDKMVSDTVQTMRRYAQLRSHIEAMPPALLDAEAKSELVLSSLTTAVQERVAYANALQDVQSGAVVRPDPALSAESMRALVGSQQERWKGAEALNQRLIDILSGTLLPSGVPKGFSMQQVYLDMLAWRYQELMRYHNLAAKDPHLTKAALRIQELKAKDQTRLTPAERVELVRAEALLGDRDGAIQALKEERQDVTDELVSVTCRLGKQHMDRLELVSIQHQFGKFLPLDGVPPPADARTPQSVRTAMAEHMKTRRAFHIDSMGNFLKSVDENVLNVDFGVRVEDFSNKKGREVMRRITNAISSFFTWEIPSAFGLQDKAQEYLTGPLNDALGWPEGKTTWEELTPEEQQLVEQKSKSVLDIIRGFDRTKIDQFKETLQLIQDSPSAERLLNQETLEPLPLVRVTSQNRRELEQHYGTATVYLMLFAQLDRDWGSQAPPSGLFGEYQKFFVGINENVGIHFDTQAALSDLSNRYTWLAETLSISALALLVAAGITAAFPFGRAMLRVTGKMAYRSARTGVREGKKGIDLTRQATRKGLFYGGKGIDWLRKRYGPEVRQVVDSTRGQLTKLRYLQRERQMTNWLQTSKAGQRLSQLKVLQRLAPAGRMGGKVVSVGTFAIAPVLAAYEIVLQEGEKNATENTELKNAIGKQQMNVTYEGVGLTVGGFLALVPALVTAPALLYAGKYARSREGFAADWVKTSDDWMRNDDAGSLLQHLQEMDLSHAVEAGGGGMMRTRAGSWFESKAEKDRVIRDIEGANQTARQQLTEAYIRQNYPSKSASNAVQDRMAYMRSVTDHKFESSLFTKRYFTEADAFAELCERQRLAEKENDTVILRFVNKQGDQEFVDLHDFRTSPDAVRIVRRFMEEEQPIEELLLFNALGDIASDAPAAKRTAEQAQSRTRMKQVIMTKLIHSIWSADRAIRSYDLAGTEWFGGEEQSRNVLRSTLASEIRDILDPTVEQLAKGELSVEEYQEKLQDMNIILQTVEQPEWIPLIEKKAEELFGTKMDTARNPSGHPIFKIFE